MSVSVSVSVSDRGTTARRLAASDQRLRPCHPGRQHWYLSRYVLWGWLVAWSTTVGLAQPMAPQYAECRLDSVFPNGGCRGTAVRVELRGVGHGLKNPREIVLDGPPGVTARDVKWNDNGVVAATLDIAPDAPLGRRWLRVLNERSGLTNFAYFVVSGLPEVVEVEPNEDLPRAQVISATPIVVNGRIDPPADVDRFRFRGRAGQRIVAAIAAHALDIHGQYKNAGIADFNLELADALGRTLAEAEDTVGFDPVLEHVLPADGEYVVRVQLLNFGGFPEAVYRLTLGETPYVIGAFPAGVQRGVDTEVELFGPNVPPGTRQRVAGATTHPADIPTDFVLRHVSFPSAHHAGVDVPLAVGELPEMMEREGNDQQADAQPVNWPATMNGRFQQPGDLDWYRVSCQANQKVWFEITGHRFLRSPVDTLIQVFDAAGKLVAENDDEAFEPGYECYHDFKTTDSKLLFTAPADGDYCVRVSEQTGGGSERAVYRLTVDLARPDFRLTHFPDAIPIWGPGSTAGLLVRIDRFADCDDDIEVTVEGLPPGWSASPAVSLGGKGIRPYNTYQFKVFLTVTAAADAAAGTSIPIRIVGRAKSATPLVRTSIPLTLFYTSDTGFFRASPRSRVAVASPQGPWLKPVSHELALKAGESGTVQVQVENAGNETRMPLVVNVAMAGVGCALMAPQLLPIRDGRVDVPITVPPGTYPGTYGITVAQTWGSDIRVGMPGPCTPLIRLQVLPSP